MDPNATYEDLNAAIADKDLPTALDALDALAQWLRSGGFFPEPFPVWVVCGTCGVPYQSNEDHITAGCTYLKP